MIIAISKYSSRKIVADPAEKNEQKDIDFQLESIKNPVPYNEKWGYRFVKNEIKTREGWVEIHGQFDELIRRRKFTTRKERNDIVNRFVKLCHKGNYYLQITFDHEQISEDSD